MDLGILGFIAFLGAIRGPGPLMGIPIATHTMRALGELVRMAPIQVDREPLRLLADHLTKAASCRSWPTLNAPPYLRTRGYGGLRYGADVWPCRRSSASMRFTSGRSGEPEAL